MARKNKNYSIHLLCYSHVFSKMVTWTFLFGGHLGYRRHIEFWSGPLSHFIGLILSIAYPKFQAFILIGAVVTAICIKMAAILEMAAILDFLIKHGIESVAYIMKWQHGQFHDLTLAKNESFSFFAFLKLFFEGGGHLEKNTPFWFF